MIVSLILKSEYISIQLPEWMDGHYLLRDPKTDERLFSIVGNGSQWKLTACGESQIMDNSCPDSLQNRLLLPVRLGTTMEKGFLYAEESGKAYAKYARVLVPDSAKYAIGTSPSADIVLNNPHVLPHHCTVSCSRGEWSVVAPDSKVGTYVNGRRVKNATLAPGDVLSILNQKFIFLPGVMVFNAQNVDRESLHGKFTSLKAVEIPPEKIAVVKNESAFFHREPRFTAGLFERDVNVIAPPPQQQTADKQDGLLTYGPAVASGLTMLLGGLANPITGLGMLASSLLFPSLRRQKQQEQDEQAEAARQKRYSEYLTKLDRELDELNHKQAEQLRQYNPRADVTANTLLKDKTSLWNHRPEHSDFLDIRLGSGSIPSKANIRFPEDAFPDTSDPMQEELRKLQNKPRSLNHVPIILQLDKFYSVGVSGSKDLREAMALQMILQLTMHIGYDDLKLCILGDLSPQMEALRWLPHTWTADHSAHLLARDQDELMLLMPKLDKELAGYSEKESFGSVSHTEGAFIFLITDSSFARSGLVMRMLFDKPRAQTHVISLASHSRQLPRRTDMAIGLREGKGRMLWQDGPNRPTIDFSPDPTLFRLLEPLTTLMANTRLDLQEETSKMPEVVPFLDLFGVQDISLLNVMNRWRRSDPMRSLSAPIGISEDGNLCRLDLHEKGDGPHGLVAGTTGSGKSEMLMNYILAMAVSYSPLELSFILIDYKGGGMAQAFEKLPHTAGIITNLDGNEINRSLQSIECELERRQRLFSECQRQVGIRNVDIYKYQKLYREKKVTTPLSHLVIITDEFAELKTQQPEFLQQLIRAARIGRSLGVHLILATQKPAGVVDDQIWSNSNFHICLRVQDTRDSQDVLKREDAAFLTTVGSMFKQVGYGDVLMKAQSGWTGADYIPDSVNLPDCGIDVMDSMGTVLRHEDVSVQTAYNGTQLEAVTDYLTMLGEKSFLKARRLWAPVLEAKIPLAELRQRYKAADNPWELLPVMGEMDVPSQQCRELVRVNLSCGKNTVVYGTTGSGKAMLLSTVIEDLLLTHSADELHLYLVDFADDGLAAYCGAPQVGDAVGSDEEEKLIRLLDYLENQLLLRKKRVGGAMSGEPLHIRLQKAGICHIVVVIHHILSFQSAIETQLDRFRKLLMEGPRYGITFLATQENPSGLRFQVAAQFQQKYTLQLDSDDDYNMVLGRTNGMKPTARKGRGLLRNEQLYEFQTATADCLPADLCARLQQEWTGKKAEPIRVLPEYVTVEDLQPALLPEQPWKLPLAINTQTLQTEYMDYAERFVHLALGQPDEISGTLRCIGVLAKAAGLNVTVFDPADRIAPIEGCTMVSKAQSGQKIMEMFEFCRRIKQAMLDGSPMPPAPPTLVVIADLHALMHVLNPQQTEALSAMLMRVKEEWGWRFLLGGSPEELMSYQYSDWYSASVSRSTGIFLGFGFKNQQLLFSDTARIERMEYPVGYLVRSNKITKAKFVQEIQEGGADEWRK